ncbi:preprotein translocase subunit SecA [Candidatus Haliotispira prima]|uniref:Protein translocase subunit SecA n=1 Tax=Candidatus Haliotispira prima TaxID=3034016 RepID=A0ABY8MDP7_9SPIO|nr:preprotein translocase subunit SecA [Candidatus Haliotispira prima]
MIDKILAALFGSKQERDLKVLAPLLLKINELEPWAMGLTHGQMKEQSQVFQARLADAKAKDDLPKNGQSLQVPSPNSSEGKIGVHLKNELEAILPEAFAVAREAARRVIGERPYDVQLLGGLVMHQGKIMEMKTGEGKTLSLVAPAYLNALPGQGVHIVTVNDYLAERDAQWMGPIFAYLGLSVGAVLSDMGREQRKEAYNCDLTYGTNNEFGFDFLRDNMVSHLEDKVQKPFVYCIIDEIDSVLIDEARTPLIISGSVEDDTPKIVTANRLHGTLKEVKKDPDTGEYPRDNPFEKVILEGDYKLDEKNKRITFTEDGINEIEELLKSHKIIEGSIYDESNFEYVHYFNQAMRAQKLFLCDVDYVVEGGKVQIVDEFTGRILDGRRYSDGLHQAIEAKENIRIAQRNRTLATITYQKYFAMYGKLSGMTGTAMTESREFDKIYGLEVVVLPMHRPLARVDVNDLIYLNSEAKHKAIAEEVKAMHESGQPVLIGTVSVESSERLSKVLTKYQVPHEVLNAKNHHREALIVSEAGALGGITIATNMAGRGTDIKLGGSPDMRARRRMHEDDSEEQYYRLLKEELDKWEKEHQKVVELGGLYVLGTERHESRRIDNQLRGRSGRQGDPGFSRFYVSLDDDLMRLFGGEQLKNMMNRFGMSGDEPLEHSMVTRAIKRSQTRVENRNYEIRKHLIEYDDVMQKQRGYIYNLRNGLLSDGQIIERVNEAAQQMRNVLLDDFVNDSNHQNWDFALERLGERVRSNFGLLLAECQSALAEVLERKNADQARMVIDKLLSDYCERDFEEKCQIAGPEMINELLRFEYLRAVDLRWQEHLEQMEALREAVNLRAMAQKNPLVEYKNEGFAMFEELVENLQIGVTRKFYNIRIALDPAAGPHRENRQNTTLQADEGRHQQLESFGAMRGRGAAPPPPGQNGPGPGKVQIRRVEPKVGRNEPCPCGSGKKYKQCHGVR